jgi:hypothetical protein
MKAKLEVYAQCEECFRSTLLEYQSSTRGGSDGPPSPRALLKKRGVTVCRSSIADRMVNCWDTDRTAVGSSSKLVSENIYGGLYDPDRDSAVQVDGLLALLGEACAFVNRE